MVPANSAKRLNSKLLGEEEMDNFLLEAHKKIVSSKIKRRNKEKKNEKNGQGLIQEISSSVPKENHVTKISETARFRKSDNSDALVSSLVEISQHLAQLCDKALIAEEHRLGANQEEILCWYHYGRNFVFQLEALCDKNKIGEKKARGLIYDEVVKQVNILQVVSQSVKTDDDSNCNRNSDVCLKQSMPDDSDDDGYNGYGGYNEYGERDRGYYCCDGRYERKVSPMMSPIISPVTA
ncbi:hypothetical protein RhiirC2_857875 [Rhizophagus irregularis]|uniref:Uncharacterized protein n=1 Tax=Rhizophagus irregularis TaxID=588596 RepID=A0A2N1M9E4_9GLOM|nr:hypothetical protein RhiirC2_857875 [Rhizophagus irregularis]